MKNQSKKVLFGLGLFVIASLVLGGNAWAMPSAQTTAATDITDSSATMNGNIDPQGSRTTFWFEYGTSSSNLSRETSKQSTPSVYADIDVYNEVFGLSSDTTYYFRLVARDAYGDLDYGQTRSFRTDDNGGNGFRADAQTRTPNVGPTSVVLNGTADLNDSAGSYWFEFGTTPSLGQTLGLQYDRGRNGLVNFSSTAYNLVPDTTYYYRAVAKNDYGTTRGQTISFRTTGGSTNPGAGQAPVANTSAANSVGQTSAVLSAQVNPNGTLSSVWFEYGRTTALGGVTTRDPAGSGNGQVAYTAAIRNLTPGTTYYYRAVSQNAYGTSRGQILSLRTQGSIPAPTPATGGTGGNSGTGNGGATGGNTGNTGGTTGNTGNNGPIGSVTSTPVDASSCFVLTPSINSPQLNAGQQFTFSLTYRNGCNQAFSNATLHLTLPSQVEFADTNYPFLSRDGNVITYNLGSVAASFQGAVTVTGKVRDQVNSGDSLVYEANVDFTDPRGVLQSVSSNLTAVIATGGEAGTDNSSSTLGASVGDALGGLFHSGWFWLVLFLVLIALFIFWLASRRRGDDEEEEDEDEDLASPSGH